MKEQVKLNEESLIKAIEEMRKDKRVLLSINPTKIIYQPGDVSVKHMNDIIGGSNA